MATSAASGVGFGAGETLKYCFLQRDFEVYFQAQQLEEGSFVRSFKSQSFSRVFWTCSHLDYMTFYH